MTEEVQHQRGRMIPLVSAAVLVAAVGVTFGFLANQPQPVAQTSPASSSPAPMTSRSSPATRVSSAPALVTATPAASTAAPVTEPPPVPPPAPPEPASMAPVPFTQPPVQRSAAAAPAPVKAPTPVPSCPTDAGVVLSIVSVELVHEGSAMDEYNVTLALDNRMAIPVGLNVVHSVKIISVRQSGVEMGSGYVSIPEIYELQPGRSTPTVDMPVTTLHGYGSPVAGFKLDGLVSVANSYPDQLSRGLRCGYKDVVLVSPFAGSWGS